jgi:2-polyprenyl-3-methyl-5-hydroxy-6-metoxy-1,4-benzoquinol methylase
MLKFRSDQKEIIDDLAFSDPSLIENLREMELLNKWLGYHQSLIKVVQKIYCKYQMDFNHKPIVIADLGCGSGDALKCIDAWASLKKVKCKLIGIDANPFVIKYAKHNSQQYQIQYELQDILNLNKKDVYDVVILNNICHHLNEKSLMQLVGHLASTTRIAIVINDIHRHWLAYIGIKLITTLFKFSSVTKHDGPLSVLRAFSKK